MPCSFKIFSSINAFLRYFGKDKIIAVSINDVDTLIFKVSYSQFSDFVGKTNSLGESNSLQLTRKVFNLLCGMGNAATTSIPILISLKPVKWYRKFRRKFALETAFPSEFKSCDFHQYSCVPSQILVLCNASKIFWLK